MMRRYEKEKRTVEETKKMFSPRIKWLLKHSAREIDRTYKEYEKKRELEMAEQEYAKLKEKRIKDQEYADYLLKVVYADRVRS